MLAYPLDWPEGWNRTQPNKQKRARYTVSFARARDELLAELQRMDRSNKSLAVISTNIQLGKDGLPYANFREPDDSGVAVHFMRQGSQHVIACDTWDLIKDNMRAVCLTVSALRALDRTGASGILDRAFSGFTALPDLHEKSWREVLSVGANPSLDIVRSKYKRLCQVWHPDKNPDDPDAERYFQEIQKAWMQARDELS